MVESLPKVQEALGLILVSQKKRKKMEALGTCKPFLGQVACGWGQLWVPVDESATDS